MMKGLTASFLVLAILAGAFGGFADSKTLAQTSGLDISIHSTDHEVDPGQKIGITVEIENNSSVRQNNIIGEMRVTHNANEVDYESGSGSYKHSDSNTVHDLPNAWVSQAKNFGYINAGEKVTITWQMEMDDNADEGEWIQIAFMAHSDENPTNIVVDKNIYVGEKEEGEKHFTLSKTANRDVVNPGDTIRYTIKVRNDGDSVLDDILVVEDLPNGNNKRVTYVSRSGEYEIDGEEKRLNDDWIEDGFELNYLNEGQTLTITFEVKVKSDTPHGLILNNIVNVKPQGYDEWAQAAANTTVHVDGHVTPKPPVTPQKPTLPNTGIGGMFVALWLTAVSGLGSGAFIAGRKMILG